MIDIENIRKGLLHGGNSFDYVESEWTVAIEDIEKMVALIESLPVFEDTGERFVPNHVPCWVNPEGQSEARCYVPQWNLGFKRWVVTFLNVIQNWTETTTQFYSTKESAEDARKGEK